MTTILEAIKQNNFEQAEQLIIEKKGINEQDDFGWSALHLATLKKHIGLVHCLLVAGSDPDLKTVVDDIDPFAPKNDKQHSNVTDTIVTQLKGLGNKTPLHIAAKESLLDIAKLLLAYKANVNITDSGLCTPLHWSAVNGDCDFAMLLLDSQADPNMQDLANSTPLHEATRNQHPKMVQILLQYHAKLYCKDIAGKTPVELAENCAAIREIYQQYAKKTVSAHTMH